MRRSSVQSGSPAYFPLHFILKFPVLPLHFHSARRKVQHMWRMVFLICAIFLPAAAFASGGREDVIARHMNCVDQQRHQSGVTWDDVCYTGASDERMNVVNAQLDKIQRAEPFPEATAAAQRHDTAPVPQTKSRVNQAFTSFLDIPDWTKQKLDPRRTHTFDVSQEVYGYKYTETIPITIHGIMMGYHLKYAYRPPDNNFLNNMAINTYMLEGRVASGETDYKGSGKITDEPNDNYEVRGLVGKDFVLADRSIITPYVGLGYRYLLNESNDRRSTTGQYGYDRRSHYFYLPMGITAEIPFGRWRTQLNLEFDYFLRGRQYSDLSAVNPYIWPPNAYLPNIENEQQDGVGGRASLKILYSWPRVSVFVEPFFRYWKIDDSEVIIENLPGYGPVGFLEPRNQTLEFGTGFGIQF